MQQSELLSEFYRAYAWWLDAGAPLDMGFYRNHGLCNSLRVWANRNAQLGYKNLHDELIEQFRQAGLDTHYPFNCGDRIYYLIECGDRNFNPRCHINEQRIKWVRDYAQ